MTQIRDMLFVNGLERRLGRSLTQEELNSNEFKILNENGYTEWVIIPLLQFPDELLSCPEKGISMDSWQVWKKHRYLWEESYKPDSYGLDSHGSEDEVA